MEKELIKKITTYNFLDCRIGHFIGKHSKEYRLEVGNEYKENGNNLTIIERDKIGNKKARGYKYHCNICGYEDWIIENNLFHKSKNFGCSCCSGKKTIQGYNTIWEKAKWMCDLGISEVDAKIYTPCSHKKITVICPICKKEKLIIISRVYNEKTISCVCGDGISYPEKFMHCVLVQSGYNFIHQYSPHFLIYTNENGTKSQKKSDFFIPSLKLIIETDGELGHKGGQIHNKSKKTLEESIYIDQWKDEQYKINGIKTIRINCFKSNCDFIKNNIIGSELSNILDLSKIKWDECERFALNNLVLEVCEYWNKGNFTTGDLVKYFNICDTTVRKYLKQGNNLGLCSYIPKIGRQYKREDI